MLVSHLAKIRRIGFHEVLHPCCRIISKIRPFMIPVSTLWALSFLYAAPMVFCEEIVCSSVEPDVGQNAGQVSLVPISDGWSKWRGNKGDAHVVGLPKTWTVPERLWRIPLDSNGVGGVALSQEIVVVSSRDLLDKADIFMALDAQTGVELFRHTYASALNLDYGNSPRATPLVLDDHIVTLGAGGELAVLDLETGKPLWIKHLVNDLGGKMPAWGYSASPTVYNGTLIVQHGGPNSALIGLELQTGNTIWQSAGRPAAYSSPLLISQNGMLQLIGSDDKSYGAWNPQDGKRLWELKLPVDRDFNVPSPLILDDKLLIVSENNGTLLYQIPNVTHTSTDEQFTVDLLAQSDELSHDANSPVSIGKYIAGVHEGIVLLDPQNGLALVDRWEDPSLNSYASIIVEGDRMLVTCCDGSVILLQVVHDKLQEIGRMRCEESMGDLLAHTAFDQGLLIVRGPRWIDAYRW